MTSPRPRSNGPLADDELYALPESADNDIIDDVAPDRAQRQAAWIATYQEHLADVGGDPRRVAGEGVVALEELLRDVAALMQVIAVSEVGKRFGTGRPGTVVEDCHAAGMAKAIELAAVYDPARCPAFHRWVSSKRGDVRAVMRDVVDASNGIGPLPREHRRVARRARGLRAQLLAATGTEPTLEELQEAVLAYYRSQTPVGAADLDAEEAAAMIEARLTRDGIRAAVAELGMLLTVTEAQRTPDGEEAGWSGVADELGESGGLARPEDSTDTAARLAELTSFERVATAHLSDDERAAVIARLVGTDDPDMPAGPWTFAAISKRWAIGTGDLRKLVDTSRWRLSSPHAQFAHLGAGLESQFETAPAPAASAADVLRRRLGRPLPLAS